MDNVFEALGSKTNAEDFVLCEWGINTVKQKLWTNFQPASAGKIMKIAKDASDGSIPANEHLSTMRVVLAVYEYMEAVKDRMENEIQNVKTEFSNKNIESIVRNEKEMPQDEHGNVVDLGALWQEYMQKLLARFERKGVYWLNNQIKHALPLYEAELQRLQKYVTRFRTEEAEPNRTQKLARKNKRIEKGNTYKERLRNLEKELTAAKKDQKVKNDKFEDVLDQILANKDKSKQEDKNEELKYDQVKDASETSDIKAYEAEKKVGLMRRKIDQTDKILFERLIQDVKDDITQLKAYQKAVKSLGSKVN